MQKWTQPIMRAVVLLQLRVKEMVAHMWYPETDEKEDVDLADLIQEGQIGFSKLHANPTLSRSFCPSMQCLYIMLCNWLHNGGACNHVCVCRLVFNLDPVHSSCHKLDAIL